VSTFDPYYVWLGIPPKEQPPDYYRLLGIQRFEPNADVIVNAADQRMAHLRSFQTGKHAGESQRLLNEVAAARVCLLKAEKKVAYDAGLQRQVEAPAPVTAVLPVEPPPVPARPVSPVEDAGLAELFASIGQRRASAGVLQPGNTHVPANTGDSSGKRRPPALWIVAGCAVACVAAVALVFAVAGSWSRPAASGAASEHSGSGGDGAGGNHGSDGDSSNRSGSAERNGRLILVWQETERLAATLRIDGREVRVPEDAVRHSPSHLEFQLPAGEHTVAILWPNAESFEKTVPVADKATRRLLVARVSDQRDTAPPPIAGDWIDLLPLVNVERDGVRGDWMCDGRSLAVSRGQFASLMLPARVQDEYDLEVEFTRTVGDDAVEVALPIGNQQVNLILNGWNGQGSGLECILGRDGRENESTVGQAPVVTGTRHVVRTSVRPVKADHEVRVWFDGKPLLAYTGPHYHFGASHARLLPQLHRPAVGAYESAVTFHRVRIHTNRSGPAALLGAQDAPYEAPFTLSEGSGRTGGVVFHDFAPDNARLVGFAVEKDSVVRGLQPIYRGANGLVYGGQYSSPKNVVEVVARSGYAVGKIELRSGSCLDGFRLTFVRDLGDRLDLKDSYASDWIGGHGGDARPAVASEGQPVMGVHGTYGGDIHSLGMILKAEKTSGGHRPSQPLPGNPALLMTFEPDTILEEGGERFVQDLARSNARGRLAPFESVDGVAGKGLSFRAIGGEWVSGKSQQGDDRGAAETVSFWCRISKGVSVAGLASRHRKGQGSQYWTFTHMTGRIELQIGTESRLNARVERPYEWNHVGGVIDKSGPKVRLFLNGAMVQESSTFPRWAEPSEDWRLGGGLASYGGGAACAIDELALYNRALSDDEVQSLYRHGKAGRSLAEVLKGPSRVSTAARESALDFGDKKTDFVSNSKSPFRVENLAPLTLEVYVTPRAPSKPSNMGILRIAGRSGFLEIGLNTDCKCCCYAYDQNAKKLIQRTSGKRVLTPGRPIHLACVFDGQHLRLFVAGKLDATVSGDLRAMGGPFSCAILGLGFDGLIHQTRISTAVRYTQDFTPAAVLSADKDTLLLWAIDEGTGDILHDSSGHGHHAKIQKAKWVTSPREPPPAAPGNSGDVR
jgi:hypothetical protein